MPQKYRVLDNGQDSAKKNQKKASAVHKGRKPSNQNYNSKSTKARGQAVPSRDVYEYKGGGLMVPSKAFQKRADAAAARAANKAQSSKSKKNKKTSQTFGRRSGGQG